jgi:hypothetical protein
MTEITIVVSPAFNNRGKRRHDRFDARLQSSDEVICEATRQPLLDASRELLRRGADPNATICKVHASAPAVVTMRARIGVAAQYDVMGEKFVRRKPAAGPMSKLAFGKANVGGAAGWRRCPDTLYVGAAPNVGRNGSRVSADPHHEDGAGSP